MLTALDVSKFNTANVESMFRMFGNCGGLKALDVSKFDTANVIDMNDMFWDCSGLTALNLSNFNTANVAYMDRMFWSCSGLTALDVSNFNTANVAYMDRIFSGCSKLNTIYASDKFITASVTNGGGMFGGCTSLVGGSGTKFDSAHTNKEYARIDGGASAPGYFTDKNASAPSNNITFLVAKSVSNLIVSDYGNYYEVNAVDKDMVKCLEIKQGVSFSANDITLTPGDRSTMDEAHCVILNSVVYDSNDFITSGAFVSGSQTAERCQGVRRVNEGQVRLNTSGNSALHDVADNIRVFFACGDYSDDIEQIDYSEIVNDTMDWVYYVQENGKITYLFIVDYEEY